MIEVARKGDLNPRGASAQELEREESFADLLERRDAARRSRATRLGPPTMSTWATSETSSLSAGLMFRSFAGFGSGAANPKYSTGFRANSNRSGTTPAQDWKNYPNCIPAFVERLQGVVIENMDAIDVMLQHDGDDTLHYVDPPYVHSARSQKRRREREYEFEMTDEEHRDLAAALHKLEGMVVLSGYHSPLYDELYGDWQFIAFDSFADGAEPRTEVLWFNPKAWERRPPPAAQGVLL